MTAPILYIPHGGGPLPLLGDLGHTGLKTFLTGVGEKLSRAKAIVVISAHWEEDVASVSTAGNPELYYDYFGFPDAAYQITYPAPGAPALAFKILDQLKAAGFESDADPDRGYDHGTFVPLKMMLPEATVPVVQLSLLKTLDPQTHIDLGKAIAGLAKDDVVILGSGMSFHNMQVFMQRSEIISPESQVFDAWLNKTLLDEVTSGAAKEAALVEWQSAPNARFCHPREEHLLPLHVCFGAAQGNNQTPTNIFDEPVLGAKVSGFMWD